MTNPVDLEDDPELLAMRAAGRATQLGWGFGFCLITAPMGFAAVYNGPFITGPWYDTKVALLGVATTVPTLFGLYGLIGLWFRSRTPGSSTMRWPRVHGSGALIVLAVMAALIVLLLPCALPFVRRQSPLGFALSCTALIFPLVLALIGWANSYELGLLVSGG